MSDKSYSTYPGSLVGKRIKVESEDEIEDTSFTGSYLNISSHDRDIIESWLKSKAVAKYVTWTLIPHDVDQLSEE